MQAGFETRSAPDFFGKNTPKLQIASATTRLAAPFVASAMAHGFENKNPRISAGWVSKPPGFYPLAREA